jgi:4-hydroxy-tetrahydrodipicolinate synthase
MAADPAARDTVLRFKPVKRRQEMFEGLSVALVTPFRNGAVDLEAFSRIIERLLKGGVDGLVVAGCTGEAATLSVEERDELIKTALDLAKGKAFVVAGTGSNDTKISIALTKRAEKLGVDGAMLITPYYNKPGPEGMFRHYSAVAEATDLPIILYNVPSRTGISLSPETVARLSEIPQVAAIKEAAGSLDQVSQIRKLCDITVVSGDDSLTLPMLSVGAKGVVSVAGHIAPEDLKAMLRAFEAGDVKRASELHLKLWPVFKGLFIEVNPTPVKKALQIQGLCTDEVRLPLYPASEKSGEALRDILQGLNLL